MKPSVATKRRNSFNIILIIRPKQAGEGLSKKMMDIAYFFSLIHNFLRRFSL